MSIETTETAVSDVIDKNTTNVEFVQNIMEFSNHGALAQVFVIEAIRNYAENVLADTSVWPENALINQAAWKAIAYEIQMKANSKYL
jgi:hypothetical protein